MPNGHISLMRDFGTESERALLARGLHDFAVTAGPDFETRAAPFVDWVDASARLGLFQFIKAHESAPLLRSSVTDFGGNRYHGINLSSQDYLGLSRHPLVIQSAAQACYELGTHSSGSEPMGGGFSEATRLQNRISALVAHQHVVLFPTGWGAGFGGIKGFVRPSDHILMDALCHDCLQQGARAATQNVSYFAHNDLRSLDKKLRRLRSSNPLAAILVVTESLFSMDSDHPDFRDYIQICKAHGAATMVDVAHDLGALGPGGTGVLGEQEVLSDIDYLVGSFSKTFACTGGFFASHGKGTSYQVRGFSGAYTFSNFLSPAQVAAVSTAIEISSSAEGDRLRQLAARNAGILRQALQQVGLTCAGRSSPIVIVSVGAEPIARLAYRYAMKHGLLLNCIEFPACRRAEARFRLQVSPHHTESDLAAAAPILRSAIDEAKSAFGRVPLESRHGENTKAPA